MEMSVSSEMTFFTTKQQSEICPHLRTGSSAEDRGRIDTRLILGPIHPNQVMGMEPVDSHHGTRITRLISINPTYHCTAKNATAAQTCAPSP